MKKALILILASLMIFTSCKGDFLKKQAVGDVTEEATEEVTEEVTEEITEEVTEETEETEGSVFVKPQKYDGINYTVERIDRSYRNYNNQSLIDHWYDLVTLDGDITSIKAINNELSNRMEEFFLDSSELSEYADFPGLTPEYPFYYTISTDITHNDNGFISIKYNSDWMMGGVNNSDVYGDTYNLNTGKPATLVELTGMERSVLDAELKEAVWRYIIGFYSGEIDTSDYDNLYSYSLEEFDFYVDDGEIVLCFPTYTFACGAAGSCQAPTGIYVQAD